MAARLHLLTFSRARTLLGGKHQVKIEPNTYLELCAPDYPDASDCIAVRYHRTQVIKLRPNGTYQLFTGGYDTVTTRRRFGLTPARIFKDGGTLYVMTQEVATEVSDDPLREIIDDINEYGDRTLPLAVKWSETTNDPVVAAWNASKDFGAMLEFLSRFGTGFGKVKRLVRDSEISIQDAIDLVKKAKPPTFRGVLKKLASKKTFHSPIYVPSRIQQRVEFYEGIIVDAGGREVK